MSVTMARRLRKSMSPPEKRLWNLLLTRPAGFKFRSQHPIGPFVLDFYCAAAGLAIEVDGSTHYLDGSPDRDEARDAWLAGKGIATIRVSSTEVRDNLEGVLMHIVQAASSRTPPPRVARSPSPRNRGEEK